MRERQHTNLVFDSSTMLLVAGNAATRLATAASDAIVDRRLSRRDARVRLLAWRWLQRIVTASHRCHLGTDTAAATIAAAVHVCTVVIVVIVVGVRGTMRSVPGARLSRRPATAAALLRLLLLRLLRLLVLELANAIKARDRSSVGVTKRVAAAAAPRGCVGGLCTRLELGLRREVTMVHQNVRIIPTGASDAIFIWKHTRTKCE